MILFKGISIIAYFIKKGRPKLGFLGRTWSASAQEGLEDLEPLGVEGEGRLGGERALARGVKGVPPLPPCPCIWQEGQVWGRGLKRASQSLALHSEEAAR